MKKRLLYFIAVAALLLSVAVIFTSCEGGKGGKLEAPTGLRYDGLTLSWNPVEGAEKYYVQVGDAERLPMVGTVYAFPAPTSQFTVTVSAYRKGKDEVSTSHTFIPIEKLNEFNIDDGGRLYWEPVPYATCYVVSVDGVETTVHTTEFKELTAGTHSVKIKPHAESGQEGVSYFSSFGTQRTVTICEDVDAESVRYLMDEGRLVWDSVQYATGYHLIISGGSHQVDEVVTSPYYSFDAGLESFKIKVQAIGNHSTSFDSKSFTERTLVYLEPTKNLKVEDGMLYWDEVSGANGYKVRINGVVRSEVVTECKLSGFPVNTSITVNLLPVSEDTVYFSSWSNDFSFTILPAPVLKWNDLALDGEVNNNVYWDAVNGAHGYEVKLLYNGQEMDSATLGTDSRSYANGYTAAGEYEVRVKALAPEATTNTSDSEFSAPIKVVRLASPTFASGNYITSDPANVAAGFTVSIKPVAGAKQYRIWKDDTAYAVIDGTLTQYTDANVLAPSVITAQQFSYKIQSVGSAIRSENAGVQRVVLDSLSSTALSFSIDVLPAPDRTDISGFEFVYSEVSGAFGYTVSLNGRATVNDDNSFNLELLTPGITSVAVCSRGNGGSILSSNYTAAISVHRLAAPADIRISTDADADGRLSFSEIEFSTGYEVVIKGYATALPVNNMTNIKEHITTDGTTLHMIAVGNYFNDNKTVYYMTSPASVTKVFTKLEAPTTGEKPFADGWFNWNAPGNVRDNSFTPTYKVYNAQNILQGVSYNGTAMSLSTLEAGTYSFRVVAIGNGTDYINSDLADAKTVRVTKLEKPTVTITNNAYVWTTVPNAVNYAVYVDGVLVKTDYNAVGASFSYTPAFDRLKEYKVEVIAIADGGIEYVDSSPAEIFTQTKQLDTPEFTWSYSAESYRKDGKLTATVTKESPYATGYFYSFGGATFETEKTSQEFTPNSTGEVKISVYARGGGFDENEVYYLTSQSTSKQVYLLDRPGGIDLNNYGQLKWTPVLNATQYEVTVTYGGTEYDTVRVNDAACNLLAILGVTKLPTSGTLKITIRALGEENSIPSEIFSDDWSLG